MDCCPAKARLICIGKLNGEYQVGLVMKAFLSRAVYIRTNTSMYTHYCEQYVQCIAARDVVVI